MSGLHADTAAINTNGNETVNQAYSFSEELTSLQNNIEGLMTIWRGLSANEFNNSYQEQAQNLQAFQQLLNDLGESISKGSQILNNTEEENAAAGSNLF
jgi:WXG100 family type VII secretion target